METIQPLTIVIIGASGDLARRKIFPALFSLYSQEYLPRDVNIIGFARTPMTDEVFRARLAEHLTCRYVPDHDCERWQQMFLERCRYRQGQYGSPDAFTALHEFMRAQEQNVPPHRLYYLAVPPDVFVDVARAMRTAGLGACVSERCRWCRVIVEKPFGRDRESSDRLAAELSRTFPEDAIYRIDHYLGKEIVQNLLVLRFANILFEPIWNNRFVEQVQITWKETIGIEERAGYFDPYGIIRDVIQNHLTQLLALLAMERPRAIESRALCDAKTATLRAILPVKQEDVVIGQYTAARNQRGYLEEHGVPPDSLTPTYAAMELRIENDRWRGVPFLLRAGKAVDRQVNEIHVRFRTPAETPFNRWPEPLTGDHLVIRVQPDEAVELHILNKVPGSKLELAERELDLRYATAFRHVIPEAYENLLLDAVRGDKSLFIGSDELAAAWDIFTPVLHQMEDEKIRPIGYPFGSEGPAEAASLPGRYGSRWF